MSMDDNINLPGTSASFNQLSDIIPKNIKTLNFLGMKLFYASTIATIAGRKIKVIFDTGLETSVLPLDFFIKFFSNVFFLKKNFNEKRNVLNITMFGF